MFIVLIILAVAFLTLSAYAEYYCSVHADEIAESRDFYKMYVTDKTAN